MATRKDLHRPACSRSHGGKKRKRLTPRQRQLRFRKAVAEIAGSLACGALIAGSLIVPQIIKAQVSPETEAETETTERMIKAINGDYYYPESEYEQYLAERQAYLDEQAAEDAEFDALVEAALALQEAQAEGVAETESSLIGSLDWGAEDSELLVQIAMAEAESEGVKGKALVMLVVLNRVWSDSFPNTVEEVIMDEGQFSTVTEGGRYYTVEPDAECYEALDLILCGWNGSQDALYFESVNNTSAWHKDNLVYLFTYGNHLFYTEE